MRADPAVTADGSCAGEDCKRRRPPVAVAAGDPFCSAVCCRRYYGVVFDSDVRRTRKGHAAVVREALADLEDGL